MARPRRTIAATRIAGTSRTASGRTRPRRAPSNAKTPRTINPHGISTPKRGTVI